MTDAPKRNDAVTAVLPATDAAPGPVVEVLAGEVEWEMRLSNTAADAERNYIRPEWLDQMRQFLQHIDAQEN